MAPARGPEARVCVPPSPGVRFLGYVPRDVRDPVAVVGGGAAGCEAAWQLARRGVPVRLYEMRPRRLTPAHTTDRLAEITGSASLRSDDLSNISGLLHEEMRRAGSLLLEVADESSVPAGRMLAVDRVSFSETALLRLS